MVHMYLNQKWSDRYSILNPGISNLSKGMEKSNVQQALIVWFC